MSPSLRGCLASPESREASYQDEQEHKIKFFYVALRAAARRGPAKGGPAKGVESVASLRTLRWVHAGRENVSEANKQRAGGIYSHRP